MADTLTERVTGQTRATDINIEIQIMIPVEALTDPGSRRTAHLLGGGPLPGRLACDLITSSQGRRWWRRLFTAPTRGSDDGAGADLVVGGDPTRRRFDGWLSKLITVRDQKCRDPYCDAPIRHIDHITRHTDGGPTSYPNGRGVCARGNYTREMPGWRVDLIHTGQTGKPHTITIRTPTGHTYTSRAPDPP
jgi:hypothetical protein